MKYCVITYDNKIYWLTEQQCEKAANFLGLGKAFMELPNKVMIACSSVKYCGSAQNMPHITEKEYIPAEQSKLDSRAYEPKGFSELYLKGDATRWGNGKTLEQAKKIQMAARKVWLEHIKRRPELDAQLGRTGRYSSLELTIINTPIETLMLQFEQEYDARMNQSPL